MMSAPGAEALARGGELREASAAPGGPVDEPVRRSPANRAPDSCLGGAVPEVRPSTRAVALQLTRIITSGRADCLQGVVHSALGGADRWLPLMASMMLRGCEISPWHTSGLIAP